MHVRCRVLRDIEAQAAIQKANRRVAFDFLVAKRAGVYVVRLREDACVDHAVVADANDGAIIDSEEACALRLSSGEFEGAGVASIGEYREEQMKVRR